MSISRFEDLVVWQRSLELSVDVYRVTGSGSFARDLPLRNQIRRASVSVMSNIAEGFERHSRPEFRHFLSIARGSAAEVRSQLHLARRLGYIEDQEFQALYISCRDISRMTASLRGSK